MCNDDPDFMFIFLPQFGNCCVHLELINNAAHGPRESQYVGSVHSCLQDANVLDAWMSCGCEFLVLDGVLLIRFVDMYAGGIMARDLCVQLFVDYCDEQYRHGIASHTTKSTSPGPEEGFTETHYNPLPLRVSCSLLMCFFYIYGNAKRVSLCDYSITFLKMMSACPLKYFFTEFRRYYRVYKHLLDTSTL